MKLRIDLDGRSFDLDVEILEEDPAPRRPRYLPHHAPPTTVRSAQGSGAAGAASDPPPRDEAAPGEEDKICRCPLSGVVNHIAVAPGAALKQNDLIMVLEAMKMETNVVADRDGVVQALPVAEGDGVKAGQVLMVYE